MIKKKVCMIGRFGVGKTSLVRRFVHSMYDDRYLTTVGVKIDTKQMVTGGVPVALAIWDIAGEDDLAQVRLSHLRGAHGYILVADGCRSVSLANALELNQRISQSLGSLPFVLVINKADLREQWEIQKSDVETLAGQGWATCETSAKSGDGVETLFQLLTGKMLDQNPADEEE